MSTVNVSEEIAAPAADVFAILGNFKGVQVGGPVTAVEYEGEGIGMVRTISLGGGVVVERLDAHDPEAMHFAYRIINEDSALPVRDYVSSVQVTDLGAAGCRVEWNSTFEPKDVPEAAVVPMIEGIYRGGIASARQALTA